MIVIQTIPEMRKWRTSVTGTVGFIPTMGYLHVGHVSLMKLAQGANDHVVVSVFVNPKQFGPQEDFNSYPRNTEQDLKILENAGVSVAFLPAVKEIYPENFETIVSVTKLSKKLEGKKRPGHFDGVATIIIKLFNIIQPTRAYFGKKDAQQVIVMKKLVQDLAFPTDVVVGPTVRQKNGLALSSRNSYLSAQQKNDSSALYESLATAQKLFSEGQHEPEKIKNAMKKIIENSGGIIDYISIADAHNLEEVTSIGKNTLVSLAVYYGKTRLIDNCLISV